MQVPLKSHIKLLLHGQCNVFLDCEEIASRVVCGGLGDLVDYNAIHNSLVRLCEGHIDVIYLVRKNFVLEGDIKLYGQPILGSA